MTDLSNPVERNKLVLQMQYDLDAACKENFKEDPRKHLGASIIGNDCAAYSWNIFRWLKSEDFSGQMLRLFNRGHEEEARFIRWLKWVGFEVHEFDPVTNKQFRIAGANGHFGGSLDAIVKPPARYNLDVLLYCLGEFKTHNEKSFTKLAGPKKSSYNDPLRLRSGGSGVQKSKPQHYKQMCSYGRLYGFQFGLYCAVNKDTDEIYFEIVELDYTMADELFYKAEKIVASQTQLPKIAQTATYVSCTYCDFAGICHKGEPPSINCRSCKHAFAVENAEWYCEVHKSNIPEDIITKACSSYARIIN